MVEIPFYARQSTHPYGLIKWKWIWSDAASVDFHNPDFVKFAVFEQGFRYIHKSTTWIPASIAQYFLPSCKHLNASSSVTASLLWIMSLFFPKSSHVKSPVKCDRHLVMRGIDVLAFITTDLTDQLTYNDGRLQMDNDYL